MSRSWFFWSGCAALLALVAAAPAAAMDVVAIDPRAGPQWPAGALGIAPGPAAAHRRFTLTFEDVSPAAWKALRPVPIRPGWLFERLHAANLVTPWTRKSVDGEAATLYYYASAARAASEGAGVLQLDYGYDKEARRAVVGVTFSGWAPEHAATIDQKVLAALTAGGDARLVGTRLVLVYEAAGRAIEAQASGAILVEARVDPGSRLTLGGLATVADGQGLLRFTGRPSLRRIGEGVVVLIADDGGEVEVRRDGSGAWVVRVSGMRRGEPFSEELSVSGLSQ
jgi:hypothetical protein